MAALFGSTGKDSYCWKIQLPEQQTNPSSLTESLNTLFKRMWEKGEQNWNSSSNSAWTANCLKQHSNQWVLVGDQHTIEHLGYCDQGAKSSKETSFLEINKSESKKLEIKLCWNDCWVEKVPASPIQQLESKKEVNWGAVEFYKK